MDEATAKRLEDHQKAKARLLEDHSKLSNQMIVAADRARNETGLQSLTDQESFEPVRMAQRFGANRDELRKLDRTIAVLGSE